MTSVARRNRVRSLIGQFKEGKLSTYQLSGHILDEYNRLDHAIVAHARQNEKLKTENTALKAAFKALEAAKWDLGSTVDNQARANAKLIAELEALKAEHNDALDALAAHWAKRLEAAQDPDGDNSSQSPLPPLKPSILYDLVSPDEMKGFANHYNTLLEEAGKEAREMMDEAMALFPVCPHPPCPHHGAHVHDDPRAGQDFDYQSPAGCLCHPASICAEYVPMPPAPAPEPTYTPCTCGRKRHKIRGVVTCLFCDDQG